MCGILCFIGKIQNDIIQSSLNKLNNRGPENQSIIYNKDIVFGFTRLAINDKENTGMQPMIFQKITWICNGEIYNWKELAKTFDIPLSSHSDCSILGPLWLKCKRKPNVFFNLLDGVFSIILYDEDINNIIIGRDPYGVRPMFKIQTSKTLAFASEMKALLELKTDEKIEWVQPSSWSSYDTLSKKHIRTKIYYNSNINTIFNNIFNKTNTDLNHIYNLIRNTFYQAINKRVDNTERPIAGLLSGGLDSSLVCALVQKELQKEGKILDTFSIGFEGSEDLRYARIVADHIGSNHHEVIYSTDIFYNSIKEVIYNIESYDTTTVRASVGNYLICKYIKENSNCKVVFSGEGSDEAFGGYLYFYNCPKEDDFSKETDRLLKEIYKYDGLRCDRCISSNGLEARIPFLDKQFIEFIKSIPAKWKQPNEKQCEKWILRKAFSDTNILPNEILWRTKAAFSDAISGEKPWFQIIEEKVKDEILPDYIYNHLQPITKEHKLYRNIFDSFYGKNCENIIDYFWLPKWSPETNDPSAITLKNYKK